MFDVETARNLLNASGIFFDFDPEDEEYNQKWGYDKDWGQTINMNDVWGWACADCEHVPDEELPRVAELFFRYGWCGVLYWVSERNNQCRSEFQDNNRFIEFVRQEEAVRAEEPSSSKRAYLQREYTLGAAT